jgi:hypothetical protein
MFDCLNTQAILSTIPFETGDRKQREAKQSGLIEAES